MSFVTRTSLFVALVSAATSPVVALQEAAQPAASRVWVQLGMGVGTRGLTVQPGVQRPDSVEQTFLAGTVGVGTRLGNHFDVGVASHFWLDATDQTSGPSGSVGGVFKWFPGVGFNLFGGVMHVMHSGRFLGVDLAWSNPAVSLGTEFALARGERTTTSLYFLALHTWSNAVTGVPRSLADAKTTLVQFGIAVTAR